MILVNLERDIVVLTGNRSQQSVRARFIPGGMNVIAGELSRAGQILPMEWSLHQDIADLIFQQQGHPNPDPFLLNLLKSFLRERPRALQSFHTWDLSFVLFFLVKHPFEPTSEIPLKLLTLKNSVSHSPGIRRKKRGKSYYNILDCDTLTKLDKHCARPIP